MAEFSLFWESWIALESPGALAVNTSAVTDIRVSFTFHSDLPVSKMGSKLLLLVVASVSLVHCHSGPLTHEETWNTRNSARVPGRDRFGFSFTFLPSKKRTFVVRILGSPFGLLLGLLWRFSFASLQSSSSVARMTSTCKLGVRYSNL